MKKQFLRSLITAASLSAAMIGTASAGVWDFGTLLTSSQHNTSLGASYTFTQGSTWLQATALVQPMWTQSSCAPSKANPCLYGKFVNGNPSEQGLGLKPLPENEINFPDGIGLMASSHISSISIGSVQTNESWAIAGCSATFTSCTTVASGIGGGGSSDILTVKNLQSDNYATFVVYVPCKDHTSCSGGTTNYDNNILLTSVTTVPEPGALALFGAGLLGCALVVGRRRRRASQLQA